MFHTISCYRNDVYQTISLSVFVSLVSPTRICSALVTAILLSSKKLVKSMRKKLKRNSKIGSSHLLLCTVIV